MKEDEGKKEVSVDGSHLFKNLEKQNQAVVTLGFLWNPRCGCGTWRPHIDFLEVVTNTAVPETTFHSFFRGPTHSFPHLVAERLHTQQPGCFSLSVEWA